MAGNGIHESDGWEYSRCAAQSHPPQAANGFSANIAWSLMIFETINENGFQQILQDYWWYLKEYLKVNSQQVMQNSWWYLKQ